MRHSASSSNQGVYLPLFQRPRRHGAIGLVLHGTLFCLIAFVSLLAFGLITPQWATPNPESAQWYIKLHAGLLWLLLALVAVHVALAINHLLRDKNAIFQRRLFASQRWR